tara:strand:+ start:189 stop:1574 length:1386 start_codon:yes stop_codon:yes gene_type:complete
MDVIQMRGRLVEIATEIDELAELEDPEDSHAERLDELVVEAENLQEQIKADEQRQQKLAEIKAQAATSVEAGHDTFNIRVQNDPYEGRIDQLSKSEKLDRARRILDAETSIDDVDSHGREKAERLARRHAAVAEHIIVSGKPAYRDAFGKYLAGQSELWTDEERAAVREVRAASLTDASGGFKIPFLLDPTIVLSNDGSSNPFRQISRVVTGTSDVWNGVTSAGVTASFDAEAAEVSDDAPTLAQPSITARTARAFVPYSFEIGEDWPSMQSDITMMFVDAKDRLEESVFATGAAGSNQPIGVITALDSNTNVEVSMTTNSSIALADVYACPENLGARWRANASWVMNLNLINDIRQLGANDHNFTVDLTAAGIPQLLGRPLYESTTVSGTLDTATNNSIVFGDFRNYVIYDRIGMSVEQIPNLFHTTTNRPSGQRGVLAHWRVGADSIIDTAFVLLQNPA